MSKGAFWVMVAGLSLLPVWRSGLREHLSFYEFIMNHTIWGPAVEYIPEEYLTRSPVETSTAIYMEIR